MGEWRNRMKSDSVRCALWIALCFTLTSAAYISWVYRLVEMAGSAATDWLSMVAGYLFQAAGLALAAVVLRRRPGAGFSRAFTLSALLFVAVSVPALLVNTLVAAVVFGFLMNLFCGVISGFYIYAIGTRIRGSRRSVVFGCGYAVATVIVALLALVGKGGFLNSRFAPYAGIPLAVAVALLTIRRDWLGCGEEAPDTPERAKASARDLALACVVIVLLSLVKSLGFSFPSADIGNSLLLELSRIAYAVGLVAAGFINDRSRRDGAICTVAALAIPFIMLGLAQQPVPAAICWGLDYLFFGFFSVFRVVLFLDISDSLRCRWLAPLGLLMGRLGDAAGTGISVLFTDHQLGMIAVTASLFFPTVLLFTRLYRRLYEPEAVRQKSEQEVFEAFCMHNDLSAREREVLRMVIANRSNGEIAEALFITGSTVKYHVHNVLQKTGCRNRSDLQKKYTSALYPHIQEAAEPSPLARGGNAL